MKPQALPAILILLLTGCAPTPVVQRQPEPALYRYNMTPNAALLAQSLAAYDLKDPDSAKFRDTFYVSSDGRGEQRDRSKDSTCVEVNGKNSYGAYAGYSWTMVFPDGKAIASTSPAGSVAASICARAQMGKN